MTPAPTLKGRLMALCLGLLFLAAISEIVLRVAMPEWRDFSNGRFMSRAQVPGHGVVAIGRPGFDGYFAQNNGDFRTRITINAFGLRNPEPVEEADGRIWIIGDSMAFGWGVEQNEIYSSVIQRDSGMPTYNVASPGANVCGYQSLLARMPKSTRPRAVVLGLILENDVLSYDCQAEARKPLPEEGVNLTSFGGVKAFLMRQTALYNFFAVSVKRIDVINELFIGVGLIKRGHAYRPPPPGDRLDPLVAKTADEVSRLRAMLPAEIPFAVLIAPVRFELKLGDADYRALRLKIVAALRERGIQAIDPYEAFAAAGFGPTHFAHDGHWSPLGHQLAGKAAAEWLTGELGPPQEPARSAP